jgi:hypothetical protein
MANLGAGRLLRIRLARFAGEAPAEIVKCSGDREMDGGDVHLWFEALGDPLLEGCWGSPEMAAKAAARRA